MAITLATTITRLRSFLEDETPSNWTDSTLIEAIYLALDEYNLACGSQSTLSGLDGATTTTLPDGNVGLLVVGAAGYAVAALRADRLTQLLPVDFGGSNELSGWGDLRLAEFRRMLAAAVEALRVGTLRAGGAPWNTWE